MNAPVSFLRAKMAPAALATAIGLAFAMSAPAQAQYRYPGTASSSGHSARISPVRAGTPVRSVHAPTLASGSDGSCDAPGPDCNSGDGENGGGPGSSAPIGYGGAPAMTGHQASAIHPIQAGGKAAINPVQAGLRHGALNYGTSQSASGYRSTMSGKEGTGPSTNVAGQQNSFTGPDGQTVHMGNQTVTGPNGQKIGQQTPNGTYGGGYGQQKGSGINNGYSYTSQNGSMSGSRTGSAPGMASANGMNMNNGGASGASEQAGAPDSFGEWVHRQMADSDPNVVSTTHSDKGGNVTWHGDQKWSGTDDHGLTWNNGKPWDGPDGNGGSYQSGHHIVGVQNQDSADMGGTSGPGSVVSASGKVIQPGKPGGSDVGGGQGQDSGTSGSGGNKNATGQYATSNTPLSGQDAPVKPKEQGALKVDYNGKLGVTDPTQNGGHR